MLIGYGGGKEADRIHRQRSLGLKISVAVNFIFVGKGSATFMLLPAAGIHHSCAWQVGQTLSHSEALAGMETQGKGLGRQTGSTGQRVLPLCFFICCHSPSDSPSPLAQCHRIIGDEKKKEPTQNDPEMKQTKQNKKKFPREWLLCPLLLLHQAATTSMENTHSTS